MTSDTKRSAGSTLPEFGVYGLITHKKPCAIDYYRIHVPLRTIATLGLGYIYLPDGNNPEADNNAMLGASIVFGSQFTESTGYQFAHLFAKQLPEFAERPDGTKQYRPLLVMDSDDALDLTDPFNSAFAVYGVRHFNGEFLRPGESVMWPKADGTEMVLWEDRGRYGQSGILFDIERNLRNMALYYHTARLCAGITVTNEDLANIYRDEGCEEVYVFPNSVIPEDYPAMPLAPHAGGPRLLWEGGDSHTENWLTIREPLYDTLRANPDTKLVVFGGAPPGLVNDVAPEQLEVHGWVDYAAYKYKRVMLNADINLCPLQDRPFNRCKSAIRWYEGCMAPTPEPTLAANVGPYREIQDGETGLLFSTKEEFRQKLQLLIDDADLRHRLGDAGKKWVLENRAAAKTVPGLMEWYAHLKDKQRLADVRKTLAVGV